MSSDSLDFGASHQPFHRDGPWRWLQHFRILLVPQLHGFSLHCQPSKMILQVHQLWPRLTYTLPHYRMPEIKQAIGITILKKKENSNTRKLRKIFWAPGENQTHDLPSSINFFRQEYWQPNVDSYVKGIRFPAKLFSAPVWITKTSSWVRTLAKSQPSNIGLWGFNHISLTAMKLIEDKKIQRQDQNFFSQMTQSRM